MEGWVCGGRNGGCQERWGYGRMNGARRKGWRCGRRDRGASSRIGCHERAGGKTGPIWEWQAGQI